MSLRAAVSEPVNTVVAARLEEVSRLLERQRENRYRVRAYRRAAATIRGLERGLDEMLRRGGRAAFLELPGVGESLAQSIQTLVVTGRLPMLERLRGGSDPVALLATVPGIGRRTAERLEHDLGLESLEDLESAAHDGRLATIAGIGEKRLSGIRDSLAQRLGRVRRPPTREAPSVAELLDVDREYRDKVAAGLLLKIAPKRLNPKSDSWLPILHTLRGERHYTALFSNTPHAHAMAATRDWVVLYYDSGDGEGQATVITARWGPLRGRRLVRGREADCAEHYARAAPRALAG